MSRQWSEEIAVSTEVAKELIERQFPQLAPAAVEHAGQGWDNHVFLVNDHLVFRFPRRKLGVLCLEEELRCLPQIAKRLSVPVSNPLFIGEPSELYPHPFAGYERLRGNPVHECAPTRAMRAKHAAEFAAFLRGLHDISVEDAQAFGASSDIIGRMNLDKRIPQFQDYAKEAVEQGLIQDAAPLQRLVEAIPCSADVEHRECVVHGDLNFRNFLVDGEGRLQGVIDWGDVHIGHPAVDLAIMYSYVPEEGRALFQSVYGEIDDQTRALARFRAVYTSLYILIYAYDIHDDAQVREARESLQLALEGA
ncbi:phosphotransferase [Alicyclobacillus fastidiosus]|uniref:Phosphotransferase n=1 Tax=Alicyclobacillus fastidiosus TaxID=392011 RepID=A0ABY6ZM60_9BACL|nr:phosphotransferase [Alicyclobacillus fastidiosus]WAH43900.1 phosphotransferase [Alicyclobacillus fastidiosus]GMA60144.1 aminoglycoside phosphotransferase [Alicyclobacillus fastidiosus]